MNAVVAPQVLSAPLTAEKAALLARLVEGLKPAELYWIAASAAALAARVQSGESATPPAAALSAVVSNRLTIIYGSQTGNAKRAAEDLAKRSEAQGLSVRLLRADAYPLRELPQERYLAVVISTQGEGEPPDDSRGFVEFVLGKRAPKLPSLQFAVLGLGDSSYPEFCVMGRQLDERLEALGGTRFAALGEADVDIEAVAVPWLETTLKRARELLKSSTPAPAAAATVLHAVDNRAAYSREHPFAASVLANQRVVARDSERDVRHIELSLEGSGLHYSPGDSLGVWPRNPSTLVEQWLAALQLDGTQPATHDGRTLPLAQWLTAERELTRLNRPFIAALAAAGHEPMTRLLQPAQAQAFAATLAADQPIDLLRRYPVSWTAEALIALLRPLAPRLYSIASSEKRVGDEVHLTVAVIDYQAHGTTHWGAASAFLAATGEDGTVPVFIESNDRFRLPQDGARDIIMIGPGTGVAPFRAFVQERQESAASGRNWLFFGNRHFEQDFLYQVEWQAALKKGELNRLDLAFSRDAEVAFNTAAGSESTPRKVYVQDRLRQQGADVFGWLQSGAHIYVCGDSAHMAKDVHAALIDIIATHGQRTPEDAKQWLNELMQQGRYARDVY